MGNPLWGIFWFLILFFLSFIVAGVCAFWYIIIYPLTVCIDACTPLTDILLKGIQFPHYCASAMMKGTPLF